MKQIRKQVARAKRNGTYRAGEDGADGKPVYDPSIFDPAMKLQEDKPLSDSEQEEIDEQICGQNTTRQFAEYKARALGDLDLADKIRNGQLGHKAILAYMDDDSRMPDLNLPM